MKQTRTQRVVTKDFKTTLVTFNKIDILTGTPVIGQVEQIELVGELTQEQAFTKLMKATGVQCIVISTDVQIKRYKMPVEDFIKNATSVEELKNNENEDNVIE